MITEKEPGRAVWSIIDFMAKNLGQTWAEELLKVSIEYIPSISSSYETSVSTTTSSCSCTWYL